MLAEGTPQTDPSYLGRLLALITRLAVRFPWVVVIVALALAVLSAALAARFMGFHTNRLDLLNPKSHYNQRWIAYLKEFGNEDDVVVVVQSEHEDKIIPVIEQLAKAIRREHKLFHDVLHKRDLGKVRAKGLHFLSTDELKEIDSFVTGVAPITSGRWNLIGIQKQIQQLNYRLSTDSSDDAVAEAQFLVERLIAAIDDPLDYRSPWPASDGLTKKLDDLQSKYLLSDDGQLGYILLRIRRSEGQLVQGTQGMKRLRAVLSTAESRNPGVRIGLTGMPVLEFDEMHASQVDMIRASALSLFGVACLFMAGFGGLRHPVMTVTALIIAIAWSFGYLTLVVGHLNILSVSFGVILIGLGIDFGIHYVARYLNLRRTVRQSDEALVQTATSVGPGIITGGLTTALAFSTAALTDFTGVAELGIIAGGGILLCIVAALVVLPAMIYLSDKEAIDERIPVPIPIDSVLNFGLRLPRFILVVGLSLTAILACGSFVLRYDHNLLNMQPTKLESVQWERMIAQHDRSVWYGVTMADTPEQIEKLKAEFERRDSVARTEEVASILLQSSPAEVEIIRRVRHDLTTLPDHPPVVPVVAPSQLATELSTTEKLLLAKRHDLAAVAVRELQDRLGTLSQRDYFERLSTYQQNVCTELLTMLRSLQAVANPAPPTLDDLPAELRSRFVGKSGRHLLRVYARGDIWDMDELERFVWDVEAVEAHLVKQNVIDRQSITGHPIQTFYASFQMQRSYVHAAIYSLILVSIVLILDFRSIQLVLLAQLPMALGVLQMFGILGLFDIPLNPANMIVLPLILGIGIDDGVHVVHDYRRQLGNYSLSRSTATAVVITSATTMVGFGTMMFADHQGLRSLGQVLTIGVFCCLNTSIVILPALLSLISRGENAPAQSTDSTSNVEESTSNEEELVASHV